MARMVNRLIEPQTRRRRVPREVFGYPGTENYLEGEPRPPERVPGDPAALERLRPAPDQACPPGSRPAPAAQTGSWEANGAWQQSAWATS